MNSFVISDCSLQIIIYIAGFVTYKLQNIVKCESCLDALVGEKENFLNSLIEMKNRGGLTYPSKDVIQICKITEHFLRVNETSLEKPNFFNTLKSKILYECLQDNKCFVKLQGHEITSLVFNLRYTRFLKSPKLTREERILVKERVITQRRY